MVEVIAFPIDMHSYRFYFSSFYYQTILFLYVLSHLTLKLVKSRNYIRSTRLGHTNANSLSFDVKCFSLNKVSQTR